MWSLQSVEGKRAPDRGEADFGAVSAICHAQICYLLIPAAP